jgi:CRP-like cAMP-binding protein
MPSVEDLKSRLVRTLKARHLDGALSALSALALKQPEESRWPKRAARLLRAKEDQQGELAALRRALELQVDQGRVLDAIASCKAILDILPSDEQTLQTLDLLYLNGSPVEEANEPTDPNETVRSDAPLDTLLLTEVVPGARSVQFGDEEPGRINEIPVDANGESGEEVVDLHLEDWTGREDGSSDIAAAQAACLPPSHDAERSRRSAAERGASLRIELASVPLFGDLDPASLQTLIRKSRIVRLEPGQVLFRQGDAANSLYVVVEGAVVPIAEGERRRKLAVLEKGQFFGEIGLMAMQPRNATIEGLVETKLLAIDRRVLWELIDKQPSVAKSILRFLRARLIDRQIRTNLFFAAFAHGEREAVARQFRVLEVSDGARIAEQGSPPEGLFVVLSGTLELRERVRDKLVGALGAGDVFGGLSLLEGQPSATDVIAKGKCWLVVMGEGRFRKILDANPRLARVLRRLAREGRAGEKGDLPPVAAL